MMSITINEKAADITIEHEKTVGELAAGVSDWLLGSGFIVSAIDVDGKPLTSLNLGEIFSLNLEDVRSINIRTSAQAELCLDALILTNETIDKWEKAVPGEKPAIIAEWLSCPAASLFREKEGGIYTHVEDVFAGKSENHLMAIIEERRRELENPINEFLAIENQMRELVSRLSDFALDVQTGKDFRAVETVGLFSTLSSKILRLIPLLRSSGIELEKLSLEENFFEKLNSVLKEFLAAYMAEDTVLSGDLAEYEVAPRLNAIYAALKQQTD